MAVITVAEVGGLHNNVSPRPAPKHLVFFFCFTESIVIGPLLVNDGRSHMVHPSGSWYLPGRPDRTPGDTTVYVRMEPSVRHNGTL